MLQLLNFSRTKISMLTNLKDYHIVETLDGNETLYFSLPIADSQNTNIKLEYYVQNEKNRYVIKEKHSAGDWYDYVCQLDLDDFRNTQSGPNGVLTLSSVLNTVCVSASKTWTYTCPSTTAKYINTQGLSLLECVKLVISEFGMEAKFDSINRIITVKKTIGEDKGCYFIEGLNLKKIDIDSDTNNLITLLTPFGKNGVDIWSINDHKYYVENYSYTSKEIHAFWSDARYTDAASLKTAAEDKLAELCRPATTYSVDIVDLANANPDYSILSYSIGDTVTLFNRKENQRQTHRIVEIDKYPEEPHRNKCQLSSRAYSIIDVQKQAFKSTDSLQGLVGITKANGDGTVSAATAGTDYLAVSKNTTTNGTYLKFNDGTMICYGSKLSKTTDSNGQATITYPTAFYETPAGIAMFQAVGTSKQYCNISWSNASSMTVYVISENAALASKSIYVNYIAIGRWK